MKLYQSPLKALFFFTIVSFYSTALFGMKGKLTNVSEIISISESALLLQEGEESLSGNGNPSSDDLANSNLNYKQVEKYGYDENGAPLNNTAGLVFSKRAYFDPFKPTQTQTKQLRYANNQFGHLVINETEYDQEIRPFRQFLPSPINGNGQGFSFKNDFIQYNSGQLNQTDISKAGFYYSDNNLNYDLYQDASSFPFVESEYSDNNISELNKVYQPGDINNQLRLSPVSTVIPARTELDHEGGYSSFYNEVSPISSITSRSNVNYDSYSTKKVSMDVHGKVFFEYFDANENLLASYEHGGTVNTATAELGQPIYYKNIMLPDYYSLPGDWEMAIHVDMDDPGGIYQIIEVDENFEMFNGSYSNSSGSTGTVSHNNTTQIQSSNTDYYYINSKYLLDNSTSSPVANPQFTSSMRWVQIRSLIPFEYVITSRQEFTKYPDPGGNRQVAPSYPTYWKTYKKYGKSNFKDAKTQQTVFLWNQADCDVIFVENIQIEVFDVFDDVSAAYTGPAWDFDPNDDLSKPSVYRIQTNVQTVNWSSLLFSNRPYQFDYGYNNEYDFQYSYKHDKPTYYFYDDRGQLRYSIGREELTATNPSQWNIFEYDFRGNVIYSKTPDAGEVRSVFNRDNQLRFSQDARQKVDGKFTYYNYDEGGRVIEVGEYLPLEGSPDVNKDRHFHNSKEAFKNSGSLPTNSVFHVVDNIGNNDGLHDIRCFEINKYLYDFASSDVPAGEVQNNLMLKLSSSAYHPWGGATNFYEAKKWYTYDNLGRIQKLFNKINGKNSHSKVEYIYNYSGSIIENTYTGFDGKKFTHYFEYDKDLNLTKSSTKFDANIVVKNATYSYNHINQLIRKELSENQQGIDYIYNITGGLKSINHPIHSRFSADTYDDLLRLNYEYHPYDYSKEFEETSIKPIETYLNNGSEINTEDYFDGRLKAFNWKTQNPNQVTANPSPYSYMYLYDYDNDYQLSNAHFGETQNSAYIAYHKTDRFKESMTYDLNGNLASLERTDDGANLTEDLSYFYQDGNRFNRLTNVDDQNGYLHLWNYDEKGNIIEQRTRAGYNTYNDKLIEYYSFDRVKQITLYTESKFDAALNDIRIRYFYDDGGFVVKKIYDIRIESEPGGGDPDPVEGRVSGDQIIDGNPEGGSSNLAWQVFKIEIYDRDASGIILAEYTEYPELESNATKYPFYGKSRLGYFDPQLVNEAYIYFEEGFGKGENPNVGEYIYELRDHQENVRVAFIPTTEGPEIINAKEFYPFGKQFKNYQTIDYEFSYQGLYTRYELYSAFEEFEARPYDPSTGRWLMVDPAGQFASPYNGMGNVPHMGIDPDGEFVLTAVLLGAAISGAIGYIGGKKAGLQGNDLFAYTFGSAIIGGISGGVGAAVGAGVSSSISATLGYGFASGFVSGAAGGAAGGAIAGFFSTAQNNATFGQNENVFLGGLKGAAIGAAAGGIIGGVSKGLYMKSKGGKFWDGEGANLDVESGQIGLTDNDLTKSKIVDYNTDSYNDFIKKHIPGLEEKAKFIADGSHPNGYTKINDHVFNEKGRQVFGTTSITKSGPIVRAYPGAFYDSRVLYVTTLHESIHVSHINAGLVTSKNYAEMRRFTEHAAYSYENIFRTQLGLTLQKSHYLNSANYNPRFDWKLHSIF